MKVLSLLTLLFILTHLATAQTTPPTDSLPGCGVTSDFLERNIDPQLLKQMNAQWQRHQQQNKANGRLSADDPVIYVPVMFHIAHLGEAVGVGSNLSEGQIQAGLATLNNIYRARGNYAAGNDTRIEFVLANCSGIDRANASGVPNFTNQGVIYNDYSQQQQVQALFGIYQDKFVNIYLSHRITGAGGFSRYGGDMFVPINTFSANGNRESDSGTLAHEMGHCLFLYHTFEGDWSSSDDVICPVNDDPLVNGDKVPDTPPYIRYDMLKTSSPTAINSCTGQPFGIGIVENVMGYYVEPRRLTPGQAARMRFHLETYLTKWSQSDAIPTPNNQISVSSIPAQICAGTTVNLSFTNNSGNSNPIVLLKKGQDVVFYVDNPMGLNSLSFSLPEMRFNTPTQNNPIYNYPVIEGNDYFLEVVAGCNRKASNPVKLSNIYSYSLTVDGTDGAGFSLPWMYVCSSSSLTLKTGIRLAGNGKAITVPDQKLNEFEFQWKKDGYILPGATNSTYPANSGGIFAYSVKAIGCPTQLTSENFTLHSSSYISSETEIPANLSKSQCLGSTIKLTSSYASNSASYTWYKDGAILSTVTTRVLLATESGTYYAVPSDASCTFSNPSNRGISLNFGNSIENSISNNMPFNKGDTIFCGSASLIALNQGEGFEYQWLRNGLEIDNANSPGYVPTMAGGTDALYSLRIRQHGCTSVSNAVRIYLQDKVEKPRLVGPSTYFEGIKHVIYLENSNGWRREWYKDGQLLESNWDDYLEINSPGTYSIKKSGPFQTSSFDCSLKSEPFTVAPASTFQFRIVANDTVRVLCNDGNKNPRLEFDEKFFKRFYEGFQFPSSFSLRWVKDGVDVPLSAFGATYNSIYPDADGVYQLRIKYGSESSISNPITISSVTAHSVKLLSEKSLLDACDNNVLKLTFPKISYYNLNLTWKRNGVIVPNENNFQLTATQSGTYTATYQGNGCSITTKPTQVTVGGPAPTATLSGHYAIRSGETANLQVNSSTKSPYFFTLSDGTEYIGQAFTTPVPKSPTISTTYALESFGTHCGPSPNASGLARIDLTNCAIGMVNATLSGGTWTTPGIWSCGSIPTALDAVRIEDSHTIALPADYTATARSVELRGNVQYNVNAGMKVGQ